MIKLQKIFGNRYRVPIIAGCEKQWRALRGFFMPAGLRVAGFGRAVAEVLEIKENHEDQANSNQHQIEHSKLVHLSFLLYSDRINDNTDSDQDQCQNEASRQSYPGNRLLGEHSKDENRQAQFGGVVEEFGQIVAAVFSHDGKEFIKAGDVRQ